MSNALAQYELQKKEVELLLSFHSELHEYRTKSGSETRGRRSAEFEVLHKSAIVLLTACWEAYIENSLTEAIRAIASSLKDPLDLPEDLRRSIALTKSAKLSVSSKNELYPWYFVGDRWRSLLLEFSKLKISELNTPDSSSVREAMKSLLEIPDLTESWGRQGNAAKDAADQLDEYLIDRHMIAHGAILGKKFTKSYVTDYLAFLDITIGKTEESVANRLRELGLSIS